MRTTKLIGSSPNLETLLKAICERYFYSQVEAREEAGKWFLVNSKGIINGFHIVKKGKRYRFEMVLDTVS